MFLTIFNIYLLQVAVVQVVPQPLDRLAADEDVGVQLEVAVAVADVDDGVEAARELDVVELLLGGLLLVLAAGAASCEQLVE